MPTVIAHGVIGRLAAGACDEKENPRRLWAAAILVSVLPVFDRIGFAFGIQYENFLGHRGFFHSLLFAFLGVLFLVLAYFREHGPLYRRWWMYLTLLFIVGTSHGVFEAFTNGGLRIAPSSPFDDGRHFMPRTPMPAPPIGLVAFPGCYGLRVTTFEAIHIWVPLAVATGALIAVRRARRSRDLTGDRGAE